MRRRARALELEPLTFSGLALASSPWALECALEKLAAPPQAHVDVVAQIGVFGGETTELFGWLAVGRLQPETHLIDDSLDVFSVHGVGGALGTLSAGKSIS